MRTPSGRPGGENGMMGVGKWPRRSFCAGGRRSAEAHAGGANGTDLSIIAKGGGVQEGVLGTAFVHRALVDDMLDVAVLTCPR
ncbi:hypothetical protein PF001_g23124 [Phytophthora fragariae]|uniref:Uncharacterized protein n=1 Tax=Phytophthora fragariae TaxID=53985 RepID=A0A6A4C8U8_9STRA|nr:hypothetical protein PF001_g23124 [Phytophthora fragariae]